MASTDGSKRIDPAEETPAARRGRTAAEQRHEGASTSDDPEVLAAEIERTREELADTLDAIADKVSPKRVAGRTKQKVGDAVRDGAESAKESVRAGTAAVKDAASGAKESLEDKASAKGDAAGAALEDVGQPPEAPAVTPLGGTAPTYPPAVPAQSSSLGAPALAGAVAAVVVALLVLRRRRR